MPIARPTPHAGELERLPPAYAPFAPVLEALSLPLRQIIHGLLAELEPTVAAFEVHEFTQQGEFEGLGGLTTRGDMAYVLQSELLLRTEAPLEFLRRFAESEILYHAPQFADPGARSLYRVMISCGPGLLGHGRIVALAALFFLARVAHERGAEFRWCYLPREEGADWFDQVSVRTVKRFLKTASYCEMTADDVADADRRWSNIGGSEDAGDRGEVRLLDWAIGALPWLPPMRDAAVPLMANAPNILGFALRAPIPDTPRAADFIVRRAGRERARRRLLFPDEATCHAALQNPFRPPVAVPRDRTQLGESPAPEGGWESQYLTTFGPFVLIRTDWGLLIGKLGGQAQFEKCHYVPIETGVTLIGVRVTVDRLALLYHVEPTGPRSGAARLMLARIDWRGNRLSYLVERACDTPSLDLFAYRGRYAVPPLTVDQWDVEFYAASGQPWRLAEAPGGGCAPLMEARDEPITLFAEDQYRVVAEHIGDQQRLQVLKNRKVVTDEFWLPTGAALPPQVLDWAYTPSLHSLTFSAAPNMWTIPGNARSDTPRMLKVAPNERVVAARLRDDVVNAKIWSDARLDGDGTVREIGFRNGKVVHRGSKVILGADARKVVRIQRVDGGYWSVVGDDQGRPHTIVLYRRTRGENHSSARFTLAGLRAEAVTLDPKQLYG